MADRTAAAGVRGGVMNDLTFKDAADRTPVRLPDGRTARLVYLRGGRRDKGRRGSQARVQLPSGAYLSVNPAELERVEFYGSDT